jgi:hypothetical protein
MEQWHGKKFQIISKAVHQNNVETDDSIVFNQI